MRDHDTYRSERRTAYAATHRWPPHWWAFNSPAAMALKFGNAVKAYGIGTIHPRELRYEPARTARSKYMPHQGKQEMARRVRPSPTLGS